MLSNNRIRLRDYHKEEVEKVWEYFNDPEVMRFLNPNIPFPIKLDDEYNFYNSISQKNEKYNFAIEKIEGNELIGGCGINEINWKNSWCVVGIWLARPFWSQGYGTDALTCLTSFIFEEMNLNKVMLNVFSFNKRAIKCYEKTGFKTEGILKQNIFRDGKYYDEFIMSTFKNDYFKEKENNTH
jgi:RimJ/RimL family protein N-acetyltransferase